MDQDEVHSFIGHDEIRRFFDELRGQPVYFVGHNSISFDAPVTAKLAGGTATVDNTVDTLVLSYLYDPAIAGGHSLEAWGERLKDPKGDFHDWSGYSPEMDKYCQQDVRLGKKVARALWTRMRRMGFSELSCEIEHQIREVVDEQQSNGWYFDIAGAQSLVGQLRAEQSDLEAPIRELFPRRLVVAGTYKRRTRQDGGEFASFLRHCEQYPEIRHNADGTYSTLDFQEFNIGSPKQRVERLLDLGWEPENFTPNKTEQWPKGFPKVDEEALIAFAESSGRPEAKAIAEWLVLQGRTTMIEGWLNNVNYDDHCMHGRVFTCAATTRRFIHNRPNCVPLSSQALTRDGWKYFNELLVGEDILAYDLETQTKKWTPLLDISVFEEAEIYSFGQQNPNKRFYCTKNHSWVVKDRDCKGVKNTEKLVEAQKLKHNRPVKINAPFDNDVKESDFKLIAKKYDHDWISEICKMSDAELHAIMQGFLLADGCRHQDTWMFAQAEGHLLDAFLTCLYLVSDTRTSAVQKRPLRGPNQRMGYNVIQTKSKYMRTKDMSLRYEGIEPVWCPTTKFGTWIMKQDDFITITGNTANIPKAKEKVKYGIESRRLWQARPGRREVGYDASGLESRMFAEYLANDEATLLFTTGDPHLVNTRNLELPDEMRDLTVKNGFYCYLYGGGDAKLGITLKPELRGDAARVYGKWARGILEKGTPGLARLVASIQDEFRSTGGLLRTIDGGFVRCHSKSAALNYKLQSAGAIVMKKAAILARNEIRRRGLDGFYVGNIHDEGQLDAHPRDADEIGKVCVKAITDAGLVLGFKVPLTGDYKVGLDWSQTH